MDLIYIIYKLKRLLIAVFFYRNGYIILSIFCKNRQSIFCEDILKPFEAYITANAFTRSRLRSVGVADDSVVTANEIAAATAALRVWATDGALHVYSGEAAALTVVRSDGRVVYAASIAPGDTRLALPSGIYMIRINNITYKIAL